MDERKFNTANQLFSTFKSTNILNIAEWSDSAQDAISFFNNIDALIQDWEGFDGAVEYGIIYVDCTVEDFNNAIRYYWNNLNLVLPIAQNACLQHKIDEALEDGYAYDFEPVKIRLFTNSQGTFQFEFKTLDNQTLVNSDEIVGTIHLGKALHTEPPGK